ncbi:MAG: OmpA family protein, partial [Bacteroidota bacterium]
ASLVENPNSQIAVVGHTDDVGEADANLDLSARRAQTVVAYLAARGVAPERLKAVGKGETEPLVNDTTPEARAQNRRVEVYILPTG